MTSHEHDDNDDKGSESETRGHTTNASGRSLASREAIERVHRSRSQYVADTLFSSVLSHLCTVAIAMVAYGNFMLFRPYFVTLAWSVAVGIGLRGINVQLIELCHSLVEGKLRAESYVARILKNAMSSVHGALSGNQGVAVRNQSIVVLVMGAFFLFAACCLFSSALVFGIIAAVVAALALALLLTHFLDEHLLLYRYFIGDDSLITGLVIMVGGAIVIAGMAITSVMVVRESLSIALSVSRSTGFGIDATAGSSMQHIDMERVSTYASDYLGTDAAAYIEEYVDKERGIIKYAQLMAAAGMSNGTVTALMPIVEGIEEIMLVADKRSATTSTNSRDKTNSSTQTRVKTGEHGKHNGQEEEDEAEEDEEEADGVLGEDSMHMHGEDGKVGRLVKIFQNLDYASLLGDDSPISIDIAKETLMSVLTLAMSLLVTMVNSSVDFAIQALIFCTAVLHLAQSETDPLETLLLPIMPVVMHQTRRTSSGYNITRNSSHRYAEKDAVAAHVRAVQQILNQVVLIPIKMGVSKAMATLLLFAGFHLAGYLDYVFIACSLAFLFAVVPILPVHIACLPWSIAMLMRPHSRLAGVALFLTHQVLIVSIDASILGHLADGDCGGGADVSPNNRNTKTRISQTDSIAGSTPASSSSDMAETASLRNNTRGSSHLMSYLSSFSVVLGVGAFGFQGILLGPLLVCSALLAHRAFMAYSGGIETSSIEQAVEDGDDVFADISCDRETRVQAYGGDDDAETREGPLASSPSETAATRHNTGGDDDHDADDAFTVPASHRRLPRPSFNLLKLRQARTSIVNDIVHRFVGGLGD